MVSAILRMKLMHLIFGNNSKIYMCFCKKLKNLRGNCHVRKKEGKKGKGNVPLCPIPGRGKQQSLGIVPLF